MTPTMSASHACHFATHAFTTQAPPASIVKFANQDTFCFQARSNARRSAGQGFTKIPATTRAKFARQTARTARQPTPA